MIFWLKKDLSSSEICLSSGNNAPSSRSRFSPSKKVREVPSALLANHLSTALLFEGKCRQLYPAARLHLIQDQSLHTYFCRHTAHAVWVFLSSKEITFYLCQLPLSNLTKELLSTFFIAFFKYSGLRNQHYMPLPSLYSCLSFYQAELLTNNSEFVHYKTRYCTSLLPRWICFQFPDATII